MVLAVVVCSSPTTEAGPLAHATIEGDNTLQWRAARRPTTPKTFERLGTTG